MSISLGFDPVSSTDAQVLILGSMPGTMSIAKQQYYAHPRNSFWPIMGVLFDAKPELDYSQRITLLLTHQVAIWDVLKCCDREGSLDSKIVTESMVINNFTDFFIVHNAIKKIFFNGKTAENLFKKRVIPVLPKEFTYLEYHCLPSSSPAYASLTLAQKTEVWKIIKLSTTNTYD